MSQPLIVKDKKFIYLISIAVATGTFNLGYSAVSLSFLQKRINLQNNTDSNFYFSIATSALPIGALIGSLVYQKIIDRFGDRKFMMILDVIGILTYLLHVFSLSIMPLLIARLVIGIVIGCNLGLIPSYIASIAPQQMSGLLCSFTQIQATVGVLICYIMALTLRQVQQTSRFDIFVFFIVPILTCSWRFLTLLYYFPFDKMQTYLKKNQAQQVIKYLQIFYQKPSLQQFKKLKIDQQRKSRISKFQCQVIGEEAMRINLNKRKAVAFTIIIANQLCGINTIFYYTKQIFDKVANGDEITSKRLSLTLGVIQVIFTLASGLIIDRFGSKKMMIVGMAVVCSSLFAAFISDNAGIQSLLVIGIFSHIIGFALSLGPVTFAYLAMILQDITNPLVLLWVQTIFVTLVSAELIANIGIGNLFFCYGLITGFCMLYLMKNMKEIKGMTKTQIINQFNVDPEDRLNKLKGKTSSKGLQMQFIEQQQIELSQTK